MRIGANPIGWSNDDMRELGGETPLETCLAEAKEAGFEGMELGHKFPREPTALTAVLGRFGLELVSGWYSAELLRALRRRGDRGAAAASRPAEGAGLQGPGVRRDLERDPRRPREAARRAAGPRAGDWAGVRRAA